VSLQGEQRRMAGRMPSFAILAFILAYLVIGYLTLDETTRFVPLLAGTVTLLLLVADMLAVARRGAHAGDGAGAEGGGVKVPESRGREVLAILFVAGGVAAIYLLGFLLAIPLYLFTSIAYLGQQSVRTAAIVTALASLLIYLVFEIALSYQLFPGIVFS